MQHDNILYLNINSDYFKKIYEFMQYSYVYPSDIKLVKKPSILTLEEYLNDDWYTFYFQNLTIKQCQLFYNACDYLGMDCLCNLVLSHTSYLLNTNDNKLITNELLLPCLPNIITIYDIDKKTFMCMNENEIELYIQKQKRKWDIIINY